MKNLKKLVGIMTLFGLFLGAFPQAAIADDVALNEITQIQKLGFTSSLSGSEPYVLNQNINGNYELDISGSGQDVYEVGIDLVVNNPSDLYSDTYELTDEDNLNTFARLMVDPDKNIILLDPNQDKPLAISGDYKEGIYNVTGSIDLISSTGSLELDFTMIISNGLKLEKVTNNPQASTEMQLIGDGLNINDPSGYVTVKSIWNIVATRTDSLVSYNVLVSVQDLAGNIEELEIPYDVKIYNGTESPTMIDYSTQVDLIGDNPTTAERFETFIEQGAELSFDNGSTNLFFGGNVDLTKVSNNYSLEYKAGNLIIEENKALVSSVMPSQANAVRAINIQDTKGPNAVTNYIATGFDGYVQLKWENPSNLDFAGVNIYKSTISNFDWKTATPVAQIEKELNSYEDKDVVNGATYYYILVPRDDMSPANYGEASKLISATPNVVLIAAAKTTGENASYAVEEPDENKEVKTEIKEKEEKPKEDEEDKALPAFGIFVLTLLGAIGIYLLYLQKPEWFTWMMFWKK